MSKKKPGMYYTPKRLFNGIDLLTGKEITIEVETGKFLSKVAGWLVKGITVMPPYNTASSGQVGTVESESNDE